MKSICENCGAQIEYEETDRIVNCEYCNTSFKNTKYVKKEVKEDSPFEGIISLIEDVKDNLFSYVFWLVVLYFAVIRSGFLGDTINGLKYDDPSQYFKEGQEVALVLDYPNQSLFDDDSDITITLNGVELAEMKEGQSKMVTLKLEPDKTYRLRAKTGTFSASKVKIKISDSTEGLIFQYDEGKLMDVTPLAEY